MKVIDSGLAKPSRRGRSIRNRIEGGFVGTPTRASPSN